MNTKKIRQGLYMSQKEFAQAVGVSSTTVVKWETHKASPSLRHQKKVIELAKENQVAVE